MPTSDQVYELLSVNSNKVLDVSGGSLEDGAPVIQYTSQDTPNQLWYFKTLGPVNGQEAYQIVNINSGKVLDVGDGSQDAGAPLQQRTPTGATSQQWYLTPLGNVNWQQIYQIVNVNSGKVVDVTGGSQDDGAAVEQWPSNEGTNQQWLLLAAAVPNQPQLVIEKKFMQNYRVSSPVNGGSDVVAVCNSSGQVELFTIGSDGNIHTFFPDTTSETGYNETTITTGLQATALAAGLDSQGKVIVFAASLPGPVLYYTVETNDPSARWSVPTKVLGIPIPVGTTRIMSMMIQNIAGIPYMAVTTQKSANEYHVSVTSWKSEPMTFTLLADNFASDPHCFFQGNAEQNVTLAAFVAPKL